MIWDQTPGVDYCAVELAGFFELFEEEMAIAVVTENGPALNAS